MFSQISLFLNLMFVDPCIIVQFIKKIQQEEQCIRIFIIPYLCEAQHVSGDTPCIIRSQKVHWEPLVFHTWKVTGCCQAQYAVPDNVHQLHVQ